MDKTVHKNLLGTGLSGRATIVQVPFSAKPSPNKIQRFLILLIKSTSLSMRREGARCSPRRRSAHNLSKVKKLQFVFSFTQRQTHHIFGWKPRIKKHWILQMGYKTFFKTKYRSNKKEYNGRIYHSRLEAEDAVGETSDKLSLCELANEIRDKREMIETANKALSYWKENIQL